jgi:putative endonuclease
MLQAGLDSSDISWYKKTSDPLGAVAQLGERLHGMQEVTSSTLVSSSLRSPRHAVNEDCHGVVPSGTKPGFSGFMPRRTSPWQASVYSILFDFPKSQGEHMGGEFWYVYMLHSLREPERYYVGLTQNLQPRLQQHNSGHVPHTSKYSPWRIETTVAFRSKERAVAFERYLKSHSGRAFAKKHF